MEIVLSYSEKERERERERVRTVAREAERFSATYPEKHWANASQIDLKQNFLFSSFHENPISFKFRPLFAEKQTFCVWQKA